MGCIPDSGRVCVFSWNSHRIHVKNMLSFNKTQITNSVRFVAVMAVVLEASPQVLWQLNGKMAQIRLQIYYRLTKWLVQRTIMKCKGTYCARVVAATAVASVVHVYLFFKIKQGFKISTSGCLYYIIIFFCIINLRVDFLSSRVSFLALWELQRAKIGVTLLWLTVLCLMYYY